MYSQPGLKPKTKGFKLIYVWCHDYTGICNI